MDNLAKLKKEYKELWGEEFKLPKKKVFQQALEAYGGEEKLLKNCSDWELKWDEFLCMQEPTEEECLFFWYRSVVEWEADPIPKLIIQGLPKDVAKYGTPCQVYRKCIKQKITWEELTGYDPDNDYDPNIII